MKICLMCDLHLPAEQQALQYDVLEWAMEDMDRKEPDCVLFAGDVTCDGNEGVYRDFLARMQARNIPFLYIPGNSDLRCPQSREVLARLASPCVNEIGGVKIFAVNDCEGTISDGQFQVLEQADGDSIVFMHHPAESFSQPVREKLRRWRQRHPQTALFYGHLHVSKTEGADTALQALDPDKAIGECPCLTYYETETRQLRKAYDFSPVPYDFYGYVGISCYRTAEQIRFAAEKGLKHLELRPNCLRCDREELARSLTAWRKTGGETLSIHLPDVVWQGDRAESGDLDAYMELAERLEVDRFTQHVPQVPVGTVKQDPVVLEKIADYLAEKLNTVSRELVIGVENMHMTASEKPDDTRRFGYLPQECLAFMEALGKRCKHKVGINFDFGHARNNAPYSQSYQISTWLALLGKHIVGYHMHQVTQRDGAFQNHMPITEPYGKLISYASFFRYWSQERVNKVPVIWEMPGETSYATTQETFEKQRGRTVFDVHSHSRYSNCGKDDPRELIQKAVEQGVRVLGICDHNYGIGKRKAEYLDVMGALAEEYKGKLRLLCGIEIATMPHLFDLESEQEIKDYDYCLLEHIDQAGSLAEADLFGFCKKLGIRCGIAHTDLFAYCDSRGYDYREFFSRMAENGIFWEMNVSYDKIHKYREHAYVADFVADRRKQAVIRETGVTVSIGSDSHRCAEYNGFRLVEMYDFLKENGIRMLVEQL